MAGPQLGHHGAYGYTDLQTFGEPVIEGRETSAAISGPKVVAVGTDGKVATAATDTTASLCIGVCINSPVSGGEAQVVRLGLAENVPATGSVSAGDLLIRSATTAGSVSASATPTAGQVVGRAINASSSNTVDMEVLPGALS